MASQATPSPGGQRLPSTRTKPGCTASRSTARSIARIDAHRMLIASISAASARPSAQASAWSRISAASTSRRRAESFFESASPAIGRAGSRITAAAITAPASGPRPASSTPAISIGGSAKGMSKSTVCMTLFRIVKR